jgi:WD40 repeat protein
VGFALGDESLEIGRMQASVRACILRAATASVRGVRHTPPHVLLSLLCASALTPIIPAAFGVMTATGLLGAAASASTVLSGVSGAALSGIIAAAAEHFHPKNGPSPTRAPAALEERLATEVSKVLAAGDEHAQELRVEIAELLQKIDAGGTIAVAAMEQGNERIRGDMIAAIGVLGTDFAEMRFLIEDVAQAAAQIQKSLDVQGADIRAIIEQNREQSADIRLFRDHVAAIARRVDTDELVGGAGNSAGLRWARGCPYRGLLPFEETDADIFYGRERLTAELAIKLAAQVSCGGLVVVTGASGAGKSSLLRAGLLPKLAEGQQVAGSEHWPRMVVTPTKDPLTELAARLAALGGGDTLTIREGLAQHPGQAHLAVWPVILADAARRSVSQSAASATATRLVLIVDQFEQAFTLNTGPEGEARRGAFITALCAAATNPVGSRQEPPALVVIAVRGDFWDRCASYPALADALQDRQFVVGPMTESDLRLAITGPAEAANLRIDPALIDTIIGDLRAAGGDMGAGVLPLLSQAMAMTWDLREGNQLTGHGYGQSGGVSRAVQVSADRLYDDLPVRQQMLARELLRRMTLVSRDGRIARRPVSKDDLYTGRSEADRIQVDDVLEAFAAQRLIVLDGDTAQISHDVLLSAWPRLRGWLEEDRANWIVYGQLADDATAWHGGGQDGSFLYRGTRLTVLRQAIIGWNADPTRFPALTPVQRAFLAASERASTLISRRRKTLAGLVVLLLVVSMASAGLAVVAATNANRQRINAVSGQLAAESETLDSADPATAALLAAAAWRLDPTPQARDALLDVLAQPAYGVLPGGPGSGGLTALAFSPKTDSLATVDGNGLVGFWDTATRNRVGQLEHQPPSDADTVVFSPNGKILVVAGASGEAQLWNAATHHLISTLTAGESTFSGSTGITHNSAAFSPDGKTLAMVTAAGSVQLWDVATKARDGAPLVSSNRRIVAIAFQPGSKLLAAASDGGIVQFWDTSTRHTAGKSLTAGPAPTAGAPGFGLETLAFSPNGKILATADADGKVQFWNATHRALVGGIDGILINGETGFGIAIAFSPDGKFLATVGEDGTARLWTTASGAAVGAPLDGGPGSGTAVAFSADGKSLVTTGGDGSARLWNLDTRSRIHLPLAIDGGSLPIAFSPDRRTFATTGGGGTAELWNLTTNQLIAELPAGAHDIGGGAASLAFSPDGKILATFSAQGAPVAGQPGIETSTGTIVRFWNVATQSQASAPITTTTVDPPTDVVFSPDGKTLATATQGGVIQLWNIAKRRLIWAPVVGEEAFRPGPAVAFSHDGKMLATAAKNGSVQLWDIARRTRIATLTAKGDGASFTRVAFSPDDRTLATWGDPGILRLWDVAAHTQIGAPIAAGSGQVNDASFSLDGSTVATAGTDGMARLWDTATHAQIGAPITDGTSDIYTAAFSPDGKTLATSSLTGVAFWDVALPRNLAGSACAIAGRSFTRGEWDTYVQSEPFQPVCL